MRKVARRVLKHRREALAAEKADNRKDHTGEPYSSENCPLGCCFKGCAVCDECIAGACVRCGRHSHRGRPNWCSKECAEGDEIARPTLDKKKVKDE